MVYLNDEGQWVTDLAYYTSFEKEVAGKTPESAAPFEMEDFVPASMYKSHLYPFLLYLYTTLLCVYTLCRLLDDIFSSCR